MRNLKSTLLTLAALLCSTVASAYSFKVDGIFYNITNSYDLTVEVTYETDINGIYNSYSGDVVIPATVTYDNKVYKVTQIGYRAFVSSNTLTSVVIPEGVTYIGQDAFFGCSSLASITIPEGVTSIGTYAFNSCSSLASINIPSSVTLIDYEAFGGCSSLSAVYISDMEAWWNISFNTNDSNPLYYAKNLYLNGELVTELTIPSSLTTIKAYTFSGCTSITSITIPESVTSIGSSAFRDCSNLADVYYAGDFESWMQLRLADDSSRPNTYAKNIYFNGELLTEVEIPSTMTTISSGTFAGFSGLTSITIPNSVTSIGNYAFNGCTALKELTLEDGSSALSLGYNNYDDYNNGKGLFYDCPLETIYLGRDLSYSNEWYYGYSPFYNNKSLTKVTIGDNVTSIGSNAFSGCSSLASITIPNSVTTIGNDAFNGCSSLASLTLGNGVTSIGDCAFNGCVGLKELIITDSQNALTLGSSDPHSGYGPIFNGYVRKGLFYGLQLETLYLGRNLTQKDVSDYPVLHFWDCTKLKMVEFGNYVTEISHGSFYGCSSLTSVTIAEGSKLTSIGGYAFRDCSSLASITIPEGVTTIGNNTFRNCSSLASVAIAEDSKLTSIGSEAFMDCSSLASITIPEGVTSIGNNAFLGIKELILKPTTHPTLTTASLISDYAVIAVPKEAYSDYSTATYWADLLANITIDDADARVKNLTLTADENESALQITIGEEEVKYVTDLTISGTINSYDFMILRNKMPVLRHLNLENATIVANAYEHYTDHHTEDNKFPGYGLYNCKLLSLTFPKNITSVGNHGVANNTYLSEVTLFEGVTTIDSYAFSECDALAAITLPKGLATIGDHAFNNCDRLAFITFLDGLTSIDGYAFQYCGALESVMLPPTVKTIGYSAFRSCHSLKEIRIPSSIRSVGNYAFEDCSNITDVYVYTVEPFSIGQNTFAKNGNSFKGTLHAPKVSYKDYYYNTQWSQFASFAEFDEPYDNFYLQGDKVLDEETGAIEGEEGDAPDAEMGSNSGLVVEDDIEQDLGDVDVNHDGENGGSIIVGDEGCVNADELHVHINVQGGRWYFFCFPFDLKKENISFDDENTQYVFRCYDGTKRAEGNSGWKNVTEEKGKYLKAAEGYIFQCSQDDVLTISLANVKFKKEDKYNELVAHAAANMQDASWNFVGNPYLSYYDMEALGYDAPITIWNGYTYEAIKPGDDDYQLAPFEAFFVQKPEGTDAIEYDGNEQTTYQGSQARAEAARARRRTQAVDPERLLVNLTISNGQETDRTRIVFNNNVSMNYEMACDAAKFDAAGVPQLYTIDSRAVKYAINERPIAEGIVTLGYSVPAQGNYTLAAPRMDTPVAVKDNLTGTIHNFAEGSYTFMSEAGTFEGRFTVIMKAGETSIDKLESTDNGQQSTVIYDAAGRRVEKMEQGIYIKDNRKVVKM